MEANTKTPLAVHRFAAGLTQASLAERAGVARITVCALETGRHARPHSLTAKALAEALGVEPKELFPDYA